jgi:hypothetical protein
MITDEEKRKTYKQVFGREFDDKSRKQSPLPLDIAYNVALHVMVVCENKKAAQV